MQGRYPRTVREFADNNRKVLLQCSPCHAQRTVPSDVLEAMFGPEFDLYDGYAALQTELRCEVCGHKHRLILYRDMTEYPAYGDVSFDDALNHELERRAYVRARGEESMATRGAKRRRR